jgi:anti-anti-sigma regulatory factor
VATESSIDARTETRSGCRLVRPVGVLDCTTYRWLRDLLIKLAVEQPEALIVDLDELRVANETALTVFSSAWMQTSTWPDVSIMLVATTESQRALLRGAISHYTPYYPTIDDALAATRSPPPRRRANLDLAATPTSSRVARVFAREICEEWGIPTCVPEAEAVATELVDNVIQHARTSSEIRLELRKKLLTISVRDGSPHSAVLHERVGLDRRGNGLRIVADYARAWGCSPHLNGGKVVWAALTTTERRQPRTRRGQG